MSRKRNKMSINIFVVFDNQTDSSLAGIQDALFKTIRFSHANKIILSHFVFLRNNNI